MKNEHIRKVAQRNRFLHSDFWEIVDKLKILWRMIKELYLEVDFAYCIFYNDELRKEQEGLIYGGEYCEKEND